MKNIRYIITIVLIGLWSCNEDKWLEEKPLDFYTPDNSYTTTNQFRQALNYLYDDVRMMYFQGWDQAIAMNLGDLAYGGSDFSPAAKFNDFKAYITSNTDTPLRYWNIAYTAILNANVIIGRIDLPNQVSDADKKAIKGEALFFRAYFYKFLANLYGAVPIVTEESSVPRRDYNSSPRADVYNQARTDLESAIALLSNIGQVKKGVISKQAAQHLITEVYICLGRYTDAINAATAVIDYPGMGLMKIRFGSRKDKPGDPYWDLFQLDNQNLSDNTESIWVLQYEYQNTGGAPYACQYPRFLLPFYFNTQVQGVDGNGNPALVFAFPDFTAEKGGRGIGIWEPTYHFTNTIWGADFDDDIRNSPYMIVRDYRIDNPKADGYGEWLVADGWLRAVDTIRNWYPSIMKFSRVGYFPEESYAKNNDGSYKTTALGDHILLNSGESANGSFKDEYMYRLAGTYLLRAEAYVMNNQPDLALVDINELRDRARATPAQESEMDIDYILDEQLRELYFEAGYRVETLCRVGKMVERSRKYNPRGSNVANYQNLFPIPFSEKEKNVYGDLGQNTGY